MAELQETAGKTVAVLQSRNRGRECLETVRRFLRTLLTEAAKDDKLTLPSNVADVRALLFKSVQDQKLPRKMAMLFTVVLTLLARPELGFLKLDLAATYDPWLLAILGPTMVQTGSVGTLRKNLNTLAAWTTASVSASGEDPPLQLTQAGFHGMCLLARHARTDLQYAAHIRPFEGAMMRVLASAPRVSRLKGGGFFKATATQAPTVELDGRSTEGLFTVLSSSFDYSHDQLLNLQAFVSVRHWLTDMYVKPPSQQEELMTRKLDPFLRDCVVEYCLRVLHQSRLNIADDPSKSSIRNNPRQLVAICLNESVRILDVMCSLDESLVARIFPVVRALAGQSSLDVLEFILHHAPSSSDCDLLFRTFFSSVALDDPIAAYNLVSFCRRNQKLLLAQTSVLSSFFPLLLKFLAWHPLALHDGISELLSAMVSADSSGLFLELIHSVLDLPLVAASMEERLAVMDGSGVADSSMLDASTDFFDTSASGLPETPTSIYRHPQQSGGGGGAGGGFDVTPPQASLDKEGDPFKVISSFLLRNESGIAYNFWDGEDVSIMTAFCNAKEATLRVCEVARITPGLFNVLCDAVLAQELEDEQLELLLRAIFTRVNKLFPLPEFHTAIQNVLQDKVLAVFHRAPLLIVELRALLIGAISSSTFSATEMTLNLCWLVGEHAGVCSSQVRREYHEMLELFTYERLSLIAMATDEQVVFHSRLMLSLVSCMSKLAAHEPVLVSRVILTLAKVLSQAGFNEAVYEHCRMAAEILPTPMAKIIWVPNEYPARERRYDDFSSLERRRAVRAPEHPDAVNL